jgi:site-specific DNA recombinase
MTLATYLATTPAEASEAIIYLRLSDFRDTDDTTFEARERELRDLAADLGLAVRRVAIENDLNGNGKPRGASAYKTPRQVRTATGLITFRTRRPVYEAVVLEMQANPSPLVLIVGDDSRITRNERDGLDLLDAVRVSRASVVAPDDDGTAKWLLTNGGTDSQVRAFRDRITDARRYSDGVAANVRKGRRRWAGTSYQGGRRPFGYRVAEGTEQHARNLVVDEAEAAAIRHVADELLGDGTMAGATRWLTEQRIPTVTGAKWSHSSVRDMVLKPAVAGLAVRAGQLVPAPWKPILKRDRWEQLRQLLTNPERRTSQGNAPRWLVSLFATCGICGKPLSVGGAGRGRGPAYVGKVCGHVRRDAAAVDDHITDLVVGRLSLPDVADILRPPARPDVDVDGLIHQRNQLADRRAKLGRMVAGGLLDDEATIQAIAAQIAADDAAIGAQLATAAAEPDVLEPFRGGDPAAVVWEALSVPRRRQVVRKLLDAVVIERPARRGPGFDPNAIKVRWNQALAA